MGSVVVFHRAAREGAPSPCAGSLTTVRGGRRPHAGNLGRDASFDEEIGKVVAAGPQVPLSAFILMQTAGIRGESGVQGDGDESPGWVEWGSGAVAVGRACLLPPLSSGGASVAQPWLRFHIPRHFLIQIDARLSP